MLRISKISFPGFGIGEFSLDSVAFTIFGREIAWYGIVITLGIVFCFWYITMRGKRLGLVFDDIVDIGLPTVLIGILGARAYYVLTTLEYYDSFWDFFKIWEGGLAIYGGLIAGAITVFVMCKIKKVNFNGFADGVCPCILMAQSVGRWGNFFNGEAFGSQTTAFSRMGLQNYLTYEKFGVWETVYVHPTFLYEALWNLTGFLIANALFKKHKYNGFIFHFCFAWYGFGRMFIELLRTDSLYIPGLPEVWFTKISVVVGFLAFAICGSLMAYNFYKLHKGTEEEKAAMAPVQITRKEREALIAKTKKNALK